MQRKKERTGTGSYRPYHQQTDGLVEHLNRTLKSMLRSVQRKKERTGTGSYHMYCLHFGRHHKNQLDFHLSFELLYGREVRGPLDVIKEEWEPSPKSSESVVSHMLLMRERLGKMTCVQ